MGKRKMSAHVHGTQNLSPLRVLLGPSWSPSPSPKDAAHSSLRLTCPPQCYLHCSFISPPDLSPTVLPPSPLQNKILLPCSFHTLWNEQKSVCSLRIKVSYAYLVEECWVGSGKKIPGNLIAKHKCSCKHGICIVQLGQREISAGNELYCFLK